MEHPINSVRLVGRAETAPKVCMLQEGIRMSRFTVLAPESYGDTNGVTHRRDARFTVIVWGKLAEFAALQVCTGALVVIEGKLTTRELRCEGKCVHTIEILARRLGLSEAGTAGGPVVRKLRWAGVFRY